MPVESNGSGIFSVHHNARHRQRCAGVGYLAAGIGKKNRAQALPLKLGGDGKSPDQRHRYGIAGQLLRQ